MTKYVDVSCPKEGRFQAILLQFVVVGSEIRAVVQQRNPPFSGRIVDVSMQNIKAPYGGGLS